MENYPGQHAFEDLMARSEPDTSGRVYLADLAAELHISEAELGHFAWKHLSDENFNAYAGTVSEEGAEALRTFLSKEV